MAETNVSGQASPADWAQRVAIVAGSAAAWGLAASQPGLAFGLLCAGAVALWWQTRVATDSTGGCIAAVVGAWTAFGLVPHAAFCVAAAVGKPLSAWHVHLLDGLVTFSALAPLWLRGTAPRRWTAVGAAFAGFPALSCAAAVLIGLGYTLRHGGALSPYSCVQTAASAALGAGAPVDLLRQNVGDAQLGNAALVAGLWLRDLEMHHLHGLCGATLALTGWALGRAASGTNRGGWAGLAVLALNPLVLTAPLADENAFAAALLASMLAVALAAREWAAWGWVGAAFGLVFAMRHPLAVCGPALVWLAWRQGGRLGVLGFAGAATLASLFEHAHHLLAFGSLFSFETHAQVPPQSYRLFGVPTFARGLMNWPLHDSLIRTPHNAYAMWLQWPLHALAHLGLLTAATLAVGVWRWRAVVPRELLWWAALLVPVAIGLGIQEGWDYPNKMGVRLVLLPLLAPIAGHAVGRAWSRRTLAGAAAALAGLTLASHALSHWLAETPMDPRHGLARRAPMIEWPAWLQAERNRLQAGWFPDFGALWRHGPPFARAWHHDPPMPMAWMWHADELATPGASTRWLVDLREPALDRGSRSPVSLASGDWPTGLDLHRPGTLFVPSVPAPWQPGGLAVWATADARLAVLRLEPADLHRAIGTVEPQYDDRCRGFDALYAGASVQACAARHRVEAVPARFAVQTPGHRMSLVFAVNDSANLWVMWRFERRGDRVEAGGPFVFWHN